MAEMEIRDGILERFEHDELEVLGCPPAPGYAWIKTDGGVGVLLDEPSVRALIHALECALVPYGEREAVAGRDGA